MINGTKLLNVAGMTRGRRDGILKSEKVRHVVKIGPMHLKGVWYVLILQVTGLMLIEAGSPLSALWSLPTRKRLLIYSTPCSCTISVVCCTIRPTRLARIWSCRNHNNGDWRAHHLREPRKRLSLQLCITITLCRRPFLPKCLSIRCPRSLVRVPLWTEHIRFPLHPPAPRVSWAFPTRVVRMTGITKA
jgi:hypothetical protein